MLNFEFLFGPQRKSENTVFNNLELTLSEYTCIAYYRYISKQYLNTTRGSSIGPKVSVLSIDDIGEKVINDKVLQECGQTERHTDGHQ